MIQAAPKAFTHDISPAAGRPGAAFESEGFTDLFDSQPNPKGKSGRRRRKRSEIKDLMGEADSAAAKGAGPPGFWSKLRARLVESSDAPGRERVVRSPVVLGLVVALVALVGMSVALYRVIVRANAERQYVKAFDSLDAGDFRNAIKELDAFLAENPADIRAGKAKVYRALAGVRQFTWGGGASWDNALQAAQAMVTQVATIPAYRDASTELAEELIRTVEGLADRAKAAADPDSLQSAEAALALHSRVAGPAAEVQVGRSRVPIKLTGAREAIRRSQTRARALAEIDAALVARSPDRVYALRNGLIAIYPDLNADREVVSRLVKANDLIRGAASLDPTGRTAETTPRSDPLGPPTTLVLRLEPGRAPVPGGPVAYALADGLAFGIDGTTGAPLWQVPVGLASPFPPLAIAGGEPAVLVVDAGSDEVLRLDGRTGRLVWRQALHARVTDPPLVVGNVIYQATPEGKVLEVDLTTGAVRGTLDLGRRLARSPVADETGEHLFVLGDEDVLFVLGRDPLSCGAVAYLGQGAGTVACPPARVGRFLVVAENVGIGDGRLKVFVLDEAGTAVVLRQTLPVEGWTWRTPASAGSVLWSASDRGEVVAYSLGLTDAETPLTPIATVAADNEASGPAFGFARSEGEFWLGSAHPSRLDLKAESGKIAAAWTVGQTGPAVAPPQVAGKVLILTQQASEGPGVALWGVNTDDGSILWRTTLGASWPVALVPGTDGAIETLGFDGRRLVIGREALARGGFVEQALPKPGTFRVPSLGATWLPCGGSTVLVPGPSEGHVLVRDGDGPFRAVELPSRIGARPLAWGGNVLVPGLDGRVYLIDPKTGESAADPFVPRFDRSIASRWRAPVLVDGDAVVLADESGRIRRLIVSTVPRPRLLVSGEVTLGSPLATDLASTGGAVLVATADGKLRSLSSRDLSPTGAIDLPSAPSFGPVAVSGLAFAGTAAGDVYVVSADGRRLWQGRLRSTPIASPAVLGASVSFLTRGGEIESRTLADGSPLARIALDVLPAGAPIAVGGGLIVPTGPGSIRPLAARSGSDRP